MKKVFLWSVFLVVVFIAAGFTALKMFDPNDYKPQIIEAVRKATGRSLTIGGEMKLNVSFTPTVAVSKVSLSNPSWASSSDMVEVGALDVQLALLPLLRKTLRVERFLLKDTHVRLETGKDGRNNWMFEGAASEAKPVAEVKPVAAAEGKSGGERDGKTSLATELLGNVEVGSVAFENMTLTYDDKRGNRKYSVELSSLTIREEPDGLSLAMQTNVQGEPVEASGTFDALSVLFEGAKPFHALLNVKGIGTEVAVKGEFTKKTGKVAAEAEVKGGDLARTAAFAGVSLPDFGAFETSASVSGALSRLSVPSFYVSLGQADTMLLKVSGRAESVTPLKDLTAQISVAAPNISAVKGLEALTLAPLYLSANAAASGNRYALNDISLKASQSDLKGNAVFVNDPAPDVSVKLVSGLLNLADLIRERRDIVVSAQETRGTPTAQPAAETVKTRKTPVPSSPARQKEGLFPSDPLPFDLLKKADAALSVKISKLIAADETDLGAVALSAVLKNGVFTLSDFKIANFLSLSAKMDASSGKTAAASAALKINKLPLTMFLAKKGVSAGVVSANVNLNGKGGSVKKIASSANGKILLTVDGLAFQNAWLSGMKRFLPTDMTGKELKAQCFVVNTPVKNGVISSDGQIAFEALPMMGQVNAKADLSTEKLSGQVLLSSSKPSVWAAMTGISELGGTLAHPRITVNPQGVLDNAVSYGLAFLIGGKQMAKQTVAVKLDNPCKKALGVAQTQKSAQPQPSAQKELKTHLEKQIQQHAPDIPEQPAQVIKSLLNGFLGGK